MMQPQVRQHWIATAQGRLFAQDWTPQGEQGVPILLVEVPAAITTLTPSTFPNSPTSSSTFARNCRMAASRSPASCSRAAFPPS